VYDYFVFFVKFVVQPSNGIESIVKTLVINEVVVALFSEEVRWKDFESTNDVEDLRRKERKEKTTDPSLMGDISLLESPR
jgi:hypothetical protein